MRQAIVSRICEWPVAARSMLTLSPPLNRICRLSEFLDALQVALGAGEHVLHRIAGKDRRHGDGRSERHPAAAQVERIVGDAAGDALAGVDRGIAVEMVEQQRESG